MTVLESTSLARGVVGGDRDSFWQLVRPCERMVYRVALGILRDEADAEEVVQEAILKAFCNMCRFRWECRFSTWLTTIARNEAMMKLRRDRRHLYTSLETGQRTDDSDYTPQDPVDGRATPLDALERKELRETLTQALNSLPEKYRSVLVLRDVKHLTTIETAGALGVSVANVKTRLLRARVRMRDALAPKLGGRCRASSVNMPQVSASLDA